MAEVSQRYCRKCLLREINEAEYNNLHIYIEKISADDRTPEDEYERRLSICKECEHLLSGTCQKCGCYVELRAAGKMASCPDKPSKWKFVK